MKGQVRVEFILGVFVFAILVFFLSSQINFLFANISQDSIREGLKGRAITVLTLLLEDTGEPIDWYSKQKENIIRIGLADSPYKLNRNKISTLNNSCDILDDYDLGQYRLRINSGTEILFCGTESLESPAVSINKTVLIEGNYGSVVLEMFL